MRVLLDACSFLHFLAVGEENILIQQAHAWEAQLVVCTQIAKEIERVADEPKYAKSGAAGHWRSLSGRVTRLPDVPEESPGLGQAMADLHAADLGAAGPLVSRLTCDEDLGEFIAVSHCLALARLRHEVIMIVDDRYGRKLVNLAKQILLREELPHTLIRMSNTRTIVNRSDPLWRRNEASPEETIARMEKYGTIPNWGRGTDR